MNRTLQRTLGLATIAGLVAIASGCAHHAQGHAHGAHHQGGGLSVIGTGEAKAAPDIARSSMGIEVHGVTAEAATAEGNARMAAVLAALRGAGIADADLRTNDFSVSFERDPQPAPVEPPAAPTKGARTTAAPTAPTATPPSPPRGTYRVSNTVEVVIRDIAKVGEVLTAAASAGANNVWGISFELADREPLYQQARAQAIEAGKRSAAQLAQLTGVKLGRLVSVEDQPEQGMPRMMGYGGGMAEARASSNVPVQGGQLTVSHQVRLVYSLDEP